MGQEGGGGLFPSVKICTASYLDVWVQSILQYSVQNSVQCTVQFSVQYRIGVWNVQTLVGL